MPYPTRLHIYRTAIPMRGFEHAAARRELAEAVVVRMDFDNGRVGWGETLPRPYVTGETIESVIADLAQIIWPACRGSQTNNHIIPCFADPARPDRCVNAAICAYDLANLRRLLDADGHVSAAVLEEIWGLEKAERESLPRRDIPQRVTGVLGSADAGKTAWRLRLMRWYGLRHFKLKLGLGEETDRANLQAVVRQIGPGLAGGKYTLRVDVNGGWPADQTPARAAELARLGVGVVEQPVYCEPAALVDLARRCELPLMADESLRTEADALVLLQEPRIWWNIRLSKNGGLVRSLGLARLAEQHGIPYVLGCMVGESGILSAAQRLALLWGMAPREVEGNYGRFLLRDDLVISPPRFGYGGRLKPLRGPGLGVEVDVEKIERYGQLVRMLV